jgi:hypothetical protein
MNVSALISTAIRRGFFATSAVSVSRSSRQRFTQLMSASPDWTRLCSSGAGDNGNPSQARCAAKSSLEAHGGKANAVRKAVPRALLGE